jgi:hypothetical protein
MLKPIINNSFLFEKLFVLNVERRKGKSMLSKHGTLDSLGSTTKRFLKQRNEIGYKTYNKSSSPLNKASMLPYIASPRLPVSSSRGSPQSS